MSFFARMAAKSEIRVRDLLIARVHNAANRLGESVKCGQVELVCPFVLKSIMAFLFQAHPQHLECFVARGIGGFFPHQTTRERRWNPERPLSD